MELKSNYVVWHAAWSRLCDWLRYLNGCPCLKAEPQSALWSEGIDNARIQVRAPLKEKRVHMFEYTNHSREPTTSHRNPKDRHARIDWHIPTNILTYIVLTVTGNTHHRYNFLLFFFFLSLLLLNICVCVYIPVQWYIYILYILFRFPN